MIAGASLLVLISSTPLPASSYCNSWQVVNPVPAGAHLYGVANGAGRWVAVGELGTIVESPDRVSWQLMPPATGEPLRSVAVKGSRFVVVGDGGEVLTSDQPGEWSSLGLVGEHNLYGVAAGPSGFVAVGGDELGGALLTSPDGLTWAAAEIDVASTDPLFAVTWTGDLYVAVGARETILTSPDGVVWTRRNNAGSGYPSALTGVAGSSSLIVATALGSVRYISHDGLTWEELANKQLKGWWQPQDFPTDVVWCEPHFVKRFGYSSDGVTWSSNDTQDRLPVPFAFACGTNGELVAVGSGGHIAASDDYGAHFRSVNSFASWHVSKIAWDGERMVAQVESDQWQPQVLTSTDGIVWQAVEVSIEWRWVGLVTGANGFVSIDYNDEEWTSTIRTSATGETWQQVWQGPSLADVDWDGSRYVAVGKQAELVAFSSNGTDWQLSSPGAERELTAVASNQEIVVAVGDTTLVTTTDGNDWQETFSTVDSRLRSIAWGDGRFVVVGDGGMILSSPDGMQWSAPDSGTNHDLLRVIRTGDHFIAVGTEGTIAASSDSTSWQLLDSGTIRDLYEVCANGAGVTVFGSYGLMLRSTCTDTQGDPPVAAFTVVPVEPPAGFPVYLADLSIGEPTSWQWNLGDGSTAQSRTTTHTYPAPGTYPVTLTVGNDNGISVASRAVEVAPPCGSPVTPLLDLPSEVSSGERYTVSWTDVGASEYRIESSADPLFLRMWGVDCDFYWGGTKTRCTSDWRDSRSVFFRVRAIESCSDGRHSSGWSQVREVLVNHSLDQPGEHRQVIPAAAHTPGLAATSWLTDLVIHNPQPTPVDTILYLLHGSDSQDTLTELALRPGQTVGLADVVQTLLPQSFATTGAILLDAEQPLVVSSRTFNDRPDGTFGQLIGARPMSAAIAAGEPVRLIGLQSSRAYRSNLGFANPGAEQITVTTELFNGDGTALGSRQDQVPARQHLQLTDLLGKLDIGEVTDAYAVVSSSDRDAAFFAYASVVDNQTGDSIAMVPAASPSDWRYSLTRPLPSAGTYSRMYAWYEVASGGGWYLAHGHDRLATSRDGRSWQVQAVDPPVYGLCAGDQGLVAVGSQVIMSFTNGLDWQTQPWDGRLYDVVRAGDRWVAVGDGPVAVSSDGASWTAHPAPTAVLYSVVWTGERLVAVGGKTIATSNDGAAWTIQSTDHRLGGLAWSGSVLLALGDRMMRSTDGGDTWEELGDSPLAAVWAGEAFVAHGLSGFMSSTDGLQWQELAGVPKLEELYHLGWDGERIISVSGRGYFFWLQAARQELVLPVAAHAAGANGTSWRTDLVLHNSSDTTAQATLELLELGTDNSIPRSTTLEVNGGASLRVDDALAALFGFNGVAGFRVTGTVDGLHLASRTFTDTGDGTYGQFIPAHLDHDAIWFYERGYLTQLASSTDTGSGFRTNIGLLSACAQPMDVEVDLFLADGTLLGSPSYHLRPYELIQHNYIFSEVSEEDVSLATAEVSTPTIGCSFYAYASVIDNRSNDPVLIPATRLPVAPAQPDPRSLVLDNRTNAIAVDALEGAQGSAQLPAGRLQATVSGNGNLGRADQQLRVVCLYTNSHGELRGRSIGLGESVSDVNGGAPFWCIVPDWSGCQDNTGEAVVDLSGDGVALSFRLDAADSCIALDELPEVISMPKSAQRFSVTATGDLGGAKRLPQVLFLSQTYYGRDMLRSRVVAAGEWISLGGSVYTAKAVVLDLNDRSDNSGVTELTPE
jgi:PKD repeat protein